MCWTDGTRKSDPQRFAAALLKRHSSEYHPAKNLRDPQRFAAALLKHGVAASGPRRRWVIRSDSLRPY